MVRNLDKLPQEVKQNKNFTAIEGSFADAAVLERAVPNADCIVCMAADAKLSAEGPFMLGFMQSLVGVMRKNNVKRLLYQAGGFANDGLQPQAWFTWLLRITVGYGFGFRGTLRDNDAVIEYLRAECMDLEWLVTRPAVWSDGPSRGVPVVRNQSQPSGVEFTDLALVNLQLVQDDAAVHSCDYLAYAQP